MKSCRARSIERNGQGLGESRAGNQPTPPLVRYPSGVGNIQPTPFFIPRPFNSFKHVEADFRRDPRSVIDVRNLLIYISLSQRITRASKRTYLQFEAAALLFLMTRSGFERQHVMKRLYGQFHSA